MVLTAGGLELFANDGTGVFQPRSGIDEDIRGASGLTLADLDGNGLADIATFDAKAVLVLFNSGDWQLGEKKMYPFGVPPSSIASADLEGDGKIDLIATAGSASTGSRLSLLRNVENGRLVVSHMPLEIVALHVYPALMSRDVNGDGLADDCGSIPFKRGDVDMSVEVNITDAIRILSWLFTGGEPLPCHSSADTDDNAAVDLTDAIYLLRFLFLSGDPPLAPFPGCGRDPTLDDLGCRSAKTCPR